MFLWDTNASTVIITPKRSIPPPLERERPHTTSHVHDKLTAFYAQLMSFWSESNSASNLATKQKFVAQCHWSDLKITNTWINCCAIFLIKENTTLKKM